MDESRLHDHIYERSTSLKLGAGELLVGPGDDCAVTRSPSGDLQLLTVDQLVEGRHFEPDTDLDLIARKAIARSLSDIAAMGGTPAWSLGTGVLPKGYAHANALFDAMHRWANRWHCPLIGGDIASHSSPDHPLTLTVTVGGTMPEGSMPVLRSGAKPGDLLYVTGQIGGSFESGWHLRFEPRVEVGQWASRINTHAMIDLSDGLGRDAHRIATASGVRIEMDAAKLPISHRCADWRQAVSEGEDYELLIVLDPRQPTDDCPMQLLGPIGHVAACEQGQSSGAVIIDPYGEAHDASLMGWDH
ncbi:MAG: thiamine-phosphate kinase [bacterium]|nr:thiamine-phosphate kinase [bacterium]